MPERRQAFRREPIEVELDPETSVLVAPIPWEQRNDFGNEIIRQHVEAINEAVRVYIDPSSGIPQLEAKLTDKFTDPASLLSLGLLSGVWDSLKGQPLYYNQITELLIAICEVNQLDQLRPLVDPNSTTPTALSGIISELLSGLTSDTIPQIESGQDSSSAASIETPSEPSPILSSEPS